MMKATSRRKLRSISRDEVREICCVTSPWDESKIVLVDHLSRSRPAGWLLPSLSRVARSGISTIVMSARNKTLEEILSAIDSLMERRAASSRLESTRVESSFALFSKRQQKREKELVYYGRVLMGLQSNGSDIPLLSAGGAASVLLQVIMSRRPPSNCSIYPLSSARVKVSR